MEILVSGIGLKTRNQWNLSSLFNKKVQSRSLVFQFEFSLSNETVENQNWYDI